MSLKVRFKSIIMFLVVIVLVNQLVGLSPALAENRIDLEASSGSLDGLKTVFINVEGPENTICSGTVRGRTALSALETLLKENKIGYNLTNAGYLEMIDEITAGSFGGWDGWLYYVKRSGQVIEPTVGIDRFVLQDKDEITVFYGDLPPETLKVTDVIIDPVNPEPNQPFTIKFKSQYEDWESGKRITVPVRGANVNINGTIYLTDDSGSIRLVEGLPAGRYNYILTSYQDGKSPRTVKDYGKLEIVQKQVVNSLDKRINQAIKHLASDGIGSEWEAATLALTPSRVNDQFLVQLEKEVRRVNGDFNLITDLERIIITVTACGKDPRNFGGVNLVDKLIASDKLTRQGINGLVYALIALDSGQFKLDNNAEWNRDKLIRAIIDYRTDNNGWSLFAEGLDPDLTGAALVALSPYQDLPEISNVITEAIEALSAVQLPTGGFTSSGVENSESSAQVIQGLVAVGFNPRDGLFNKEKGNLLDNFLSYQLADGGFEHLKGEGADEIATIQGLQALIALQNYEQEGKGNIFRGLADFNNSFIDLEDVPWAKQAIEELKSRGIISGLTASRYFPQAEIKRADFIVLIIKSLGLDKRQSGLNSEFTYKDIPKDAYYYSYLMIASEYDLISGYQGYFRPDQSINREEMACLVAKLLEIQGKEDGRTDSLDSSQFTDRDTISPWAMDSVNLGVRSGVLKGKEANRFEPKAALTRAEAAVLIFNILN